MTFHPTEFLHRTGLSEAFRSLAMVAGCVFLPGGILVGVVGLSALASGASRLGASLAVLLAAALAAGGAAAVWHAVSGVRRRREIARTGTATMEIGRAHV